MNGYAAKCEEAAVITVSPYVRKASQKQAVYLLLFVLFG